MRGERARMNTTDMTMAVAAVAAAVVSTDTAKTAGAATSMT